eukprot:TRINITY_DN4659_c1_g3_i3.p1 TRINITY_DN4659_c1_g3~~TRINITY_DN4659_c1_g3_i3.p1  ORF type:complete len:132 (+),score=35.26 TRINITY_DN4659_c1_g3_i3:260-655(+)
MENGFPYILFYNIRRILKRKRYKDEVPDNAFILLLKPITTPNPLASTSTHTNCSYPNVTYVGKERGENEDGQGGGWEKGKKEQKKIISQHIPSHHLQKEFHSLKTPTLRRNHRNPLPSTNSCKTDLPQSQK